MGSGKLQIELRTKNTKTLDKSAVMNPDSPTSLSYTKREKTVNSTVNPQGRTSFPLKLIRKLSSSSIKLPGSRSSTGSIPSTPSTPASPLSCYCYDDATVELFRRADLISCSHSASPNVFASPLCGSCCHNFRRQHQTPTVTSNSNTTWHGSNLGTPVAAKPEEPKSPERLKGATSDLFELLEKAQRSRLDDQRCMLPAYFNQPPIQRQLTTGCIPKESLSPHQDSRDDLRLTHNNNVKFSPAGSPHLLGGTTPPLSPQQPPQARRILQEALARPGPYAMIPGPPKGYWVDGTDHDDQFDIRGVPVIPHQTWRSKIETDDTAKCYRRFFVGRISTTMENKLMLTSCKGHFQSVSSLPQQ